MSQPNLHTARLLLRPFVLADAKDVQRLAGDKAVAEPTSAIPHPYLDGMAESWIKSQRKSYVSGEQAVFAVTLAASGELLGSMSLMSISRAHQRAEIGYWIGCAAWGQGYATEAARRLVAFAFELGLQRVYGRCFKDNPASARVMEKAGMQLEGCLRAHHLRQGRLEDVLLYGLLRNEWRTGPQA
ncbi:GNAT family protein [Noviherbaspirillum agri]